MKMPVKQFKIKSITLLNSINKVYVNNGTIYKHTEFIISINW